MGAWLALPRLLPAPALSLSSVPGLPGFRRLDRPGAPAASVFAGIDMPRQGGLPPARAISDPCPHLAPAQGDLVPVTLFTDVRCGVCRRFETLLEARTGLSVTVLRQPLPLLGDASVTGARAMIAARAQGADDVVHARLLRSTLLPEPASLMALLDSLGLDTRRLMADMDAPATDAALATALGLARRFGFYATPSMVIGDIAVIGATDPGLLDRLIAAAQAPPCA